MSEAIRSGTLTATKGQFTKLLEAEFAAVVGAKFAFACSSGSAAVHCAVSAIDPEPGHEIVTTSITDMGALTPILFHGAIPVFADVDPRTGNVTARSVAARITPRTKAIIVTHLFGNPCHLTSILAVARKHNLPVIEDAAQGFGATFAGTPVGTHGAVGCFSLQQGKHITTGEGGLVVTNDPALARRLNLFLNKGWGYGDPKPDHYFLALNYRLSELQSACGVGQLPKLPGVVAARVAAAERMDALLEGTPGVSVPHRTPHGTHTFWKYSVLVDPAVIPGGPPALAKELKLANIFSAPRYIQKPAFRCEVFRDQRTFGNSRWPFTLATPGRGGLLGRAVPRHLRVPGPRSGAAVEREVHRRPPELPGEQHLPGGHQVVRRCGMTPVSFALVGTGGIAHSYAAAFQNNPHAELVAVADVNPAAAAAFGSKYGVPAVCSHAELPDAEVVIVCTPPDTHAAITVDLLRRGRHVLCEKPFTLTAADARKMEYEAQKAGRLLTMGSKFRYVADVVWAKELVTAGDIGEVILFENAFTSRVDMTRRWNADPAVSGGGVLIDNGTHSVDVIRYFLGPLAEVHAVEGKRVQSLPVEDTARLFVRSAAGVMGSVDLSWSLNKELDWYVNIYGSRGTIQVGWKQSRVKPLGGEWAVFGTGYDKVQAFTAQVTKRGEGRPRAGAAAHHRRRRHRLG